jgi:hypothetical protein
MRSLIVRFFMACCITLAAAAIALVLQDLTATARPQQPQEDVVNRSLKGDRLQLVPPGTRSRPAAERDSRRAPTVTPKLPDGCEAVVSTINASSLSQTAGRCVS